MKTWTRLAAVSIIGFTSLCAHAEHLTPRQCTSYPFVRDRSPTHADLMRELGELEAEGYSPGDDDLYYPAGIQHYEQVLQNDYTRDCLHHAT